VSRWVAAQVTIWPAVGVDALAVEGRRGERRWRMWIGSSEVMRPSPKEDLHAADGALLDEAGGLFDEDLADVVGIVDEDDGRRHESIAGNVAVGLEEMLEEADGGPSLNPGLEGVEGKGVEAGRHVPGPV